MIRQVVTGLGVGAHLKRWGYEADKIHEMDWYDRYDLSSHLHLYATPSRHYSGRTFKSNQTLWVGFVLETQKKRLFFSGDTGYGEHFSAIYDHYGAFDWVAIGNGQYDSRWPLVHMTPEDAAKAASDLHAQAYTPDHMGRFSLAPHDWNEPFERAETISQNYDYALWIPRIGQIIYLDGREQIFEPWWKTVK